MAEAFYILVRFRHDFSMKELDEEQASQCFPHGTPKAEDQGHLWAKPKVTFVSYSYVSLSHFKGKR